MSFESKLPRLRSWQLTGNWEELELFSDVTALTMRHPRLLLSNSSREEDATDNLLAFLDRIVDRKDRVGTPASHAHIACLADNMQP